LSIFRLQGIHVRAILDLTATAVTREFSQREGKNGHKKNSRRKKMKKGETKG